MLQAAAVPGNTRVITQHSRRAADANRPWWWPPYTSPWPWEIPLHPKDSDVALELAEQSRKILPVLLLTKTEKEPAPTLTCNQRKAKWPQRLLQVPEEHWASHQKMGSAQYMGGVWVSLCGLRSLVIISVKQDGYARGPQGSKCSWRVCTWEWPSGSSLLFPSSVFQHHFVPTQSIIAG